MKLIVCDMSGIVSIKGKNNEKLLRVLNNLKNYNCSFCTGKGYKGGFETIKNINLKVPFICENGSVVVTKDGKVLYSDNMDSKKVEKVIREITKYPFEFLAYVDLETHKYKFLRGNKKLTEDLTQPWFYSEEIFENAEDFLNNINKNKVCRLTTRGLTLPSNHNLHNLHIVVSENEFHSICNKGVNKGFGIKKIAELCNISLNDIVIIGNDLNDVDMFKLKCGYKIATGNVLPPKELLELADIYVPLEKLPDFIEKIDKIKL